MARMLITGAGGYIGQHLSLALAAAGWEVRGLSRRPRPGHLDVIEWVQGDIRDAETVGQATTGCVAVVHLACLPLKQSAEDVMETLRVNVGGTLQVLEAARKAGVERLVYTSTSQVYGGHSPLPNSEMQLAQPDSPYAASKLCGEVLCTTFARCYELGAVVLRLFNVYGTPVDGSERPTVESIFVRRVVQGLPPVIKGDPGEGRDFIHVSDVVRAIWLALDVGVTGEIINVGTGVMTTLLELARLVIAISGAKVSPRVEKAAVRPMRIQADVRKARKVLGFEAEIPLSAGLSQILELERSHQEAIAT